MENKIHARKGLLIFFVFLIRSNNKNEKKFNFGTPGRGYLSAFKEDSMILRKKKQTHTGI